MARFGIDYAKVRERLEWWGMSRYEDGSVKIKKVRCGKANCRACPHSFYAVHVTGTKWHRKEKYLGACDPDGRPRTPYS